MVVELVPPALEGLEPRAAVRIAWILRGRSLSNGASCPSLSFGSLASISSPVQ